MISYKNIENQIIKLNDTSFECFSKEMGIDELKDQIKSEIVYRPKVWKEWFNLEKGVAYGLSHNF